MNDGRRAFSAPVVSLGGSRVVLCLLLGCGSEPAAIAPTPRAAAPPPLPAPGPREVWAAEGLSALEPAPRVGWPVEYVHFTSWFGWRTDPVSGRGTRLHRGTDLRARPGDLVMAIAPGHVRFVGHDELLGNLVVVDHGQGIESYYGHLTDAAVVVGLPVAQGTALGTAGNTGRSQAPHLHLAVRIAGVAVDPVALIGQPLHPATLLFRDGAPP